jgi:hypothetical protein
VKLGVAARRDLAQACHDAFSPAVSKLLWVTAEIAICATDLGRPGVSQQLPGIGLGRSMSHDKHHSRRRIMDIVEESCDSSFT